MIEILEVGWSSRAFLLGMMMGLTYGTLSMLLSDDKREKIFIALSIVLLLAGACRMAELYQHGERGASYRSSMIYR